MQNKLQSNQFENLELLAKQVVEGFILGLHKSPFHGFSVEFAEHRLYNSGDNLKHIDWKVFGRTDKLFIKKYEEETNLRCQLLIDCSSSMLHPKDAPVNKLQFSALAAASIITILKKQVDAVGLTTFDDEIHFHANAKSGTVHNKRLMATLENLLNYQIMDKKSNTVQIMHQIAENIHKRSMVIVFSDMFDSYANQHELFDALQHLKYNKHEVLLFHVQDKNQEVDFNFENRPLEFIDMETGEKIKLNSNQIKNSYQQRMKDYRNEIQLKCAQFGIDIIDANMNEGYEPILRSYLIKRNKMN
ncbi:MAG: DUF58 domain-containing protein [Chitinophagaceae bacterium]